MGAAIVTRLCHHEPWPPRPRSFAWTHGGTPLSPTMRSLASASAKVANHRGTDSLGLGTGGVGLGMGSIQEVDEWEPEKLERAGHEGT
jgi:hypothetical protein